MEEKKGRFLRWPWNVVIYVLLALVLRIFAVPVILILMWVQRKNNPHGISEGYCLSRTRKRLTELIWAFLLLVVSVSLFCLFKVWLEQDKTYWETMDYVKLAVCGVGGPLLLIGGLYLGYIAVRDTFFPARSALAQSIRNQLPYPDESPSVDELFAMVDKDLMENAQWFGPVGIGQEWVLGDRANKIDRIRGIFVVNEIHQHHTQTGIRTSRNMELVLIDDRWQRTVTSFNNLKDLQAAADCLALRVPDALRGANSANLDFWTMDEVARENFEREFRQKQNRRASERTQRETLDSGPQDMILRQIDGQVTSRVTQSLVDEQFQSCLDQGEGRFILIPNRPVEAEADTFQALHVSVSEGRIWLLMELQNQPGYGPAKSMDESEARRILSGWFRREAPDTISWEQRRVDTTDSQQGTTVQVQQSHTRLSLVYASGAAENHTTFTKEDVQIAAEGIVDGTYQLVDLTHSVGYLWIRVTAGDKMDMRCTVEATKPGGEKLEFYKAKLPPSEAAAWLIGYPYGRFLPGGRDWKRVKK